MERVFDRVHFRATEFHVCISGLRKGNTYFFDDKDVNIRPFRGILGNMFHGLCGDTVDASQQDFSACLCRLKKNMHDNSEMECSHAVTVQALNLPGFLHVYKTLALVCNSLPFDAVKFYSILQHTI